MRKKLLSALLGTTMVVSMLAGCGSSAETSTTQTTADQKETTAAATEAASTEAASTLQHPQRQLLQSQQEPVRYII